MTTSIAAVALLAGALAVCAQQVKPPEFAVATIRQNNAGGPQQTGPTPNGYHMTNMSLLVPILLANLPADGGDAAYFSNDRIVGAADWMRSERYDIDARVDDATLAEWHNPSSQKVLLPAMLESLLKERCKLALHREKKELAIYSLVVGKSGPKMKEASPDDPPPSGGVVLPGGGTLVPSNGGQTLTFYAASMQSLTQVLSNFAGRPVQNNTGLTGKYNFTMDRGSAPNAASGDSGSSIFTVVQELGLRLDSGKSSVETLVIDHLERPSAN